MNDPVSGNPVPPGAAPEEVRDDIDAKLSTGEFIVPADVVRYIGVEKLEALINKAKEALAATSADQEELPFPVNELQMADGAAPAPAPTGEPLKMAAGGLVMPQEELPPWMITPPTTDRDREPRTGPTGLAGAVDNWTTKDFANYGRNMNSPDNRFAEGLVSSLGGFGKLALKARQNYLNKSVPTKMAEMLKTGKDLQGNTITPEELATLQQTYEQVKTPVERNPVRGGVMGGLVEIGRQTIKDAKAKKESGVIERPATSSKDKKEKDDKKKK